MSEKEKEIKEAIETLEDISSDEAKIRIAELREKYIMDRESELETAEEKGIKKTGRRMKEKGYLQEKCEEMYNLVNLPKNIILDLEKIQ